MLRCSAAALILLSTLSAQGGYKTPPKPLVDAATAPPSPSVSVSPDRASLVLVEQESMPSIATMARPILRLAGRRIDPATHGPQRGARGTSLTLVSIADGTQRPVRVPGDADLGRPIWAADGLRFAFTNTTNDAIQLWICDVETATARQIPNVALNSTLGTPVLWLPDHRRLVCRTVASKAAPPEPTRAPTGPNVQESSGHEAPVRTYQDLLQDPHDEALFAHYMTSQLVLVDADEDNVQPIGAPALVSSVRPSPDGTHLLVNAIQRPFSYMVSTWSFPRRIAVLDLRGNEVFRVADVPLAENVPIGGVMTGPRSVQWIPTEDHTLVWAEALDGGDPRAEAPHRDRLVTHEVGASVEPGEWTRLQHRFSGARWSADGSFSLVADYDRDDRRARTFWMGPRQTDVAPRLLIDVSTQDAYGDPGMPLTRTDARGQSVLHTVGDALMMSGRGASPEGDRPFVDIWDFNGDEKTRRFHCAQGAYEQVVAVLDDDAEELLVRRESPTEPANYFAVRRDGGSRALTRFTDPIAQLTAGVNKQLLKYERADGVPLSGTLYTPPGYDGSTRLPLLVWAYPREFTRAGDAGQVRGSPHRYTRLAKTSPLLLTLAGYAVLDGASMPIVGPTKTANDTFVEQLVGNAKAAIDAVAELGIADPQRAAIAGHSYGAFMTANLLAHSDLFRAGIARSGAYNRTLTPFGFQSEERTYWEAPELYFAMSPFMHAQKVDEPLLMIHGEVDNNSGTFPIQSQRMYHAIKGNGGTARLVMLPHESHGYRAKESVLHVLAETVAWLDRWVKAPVAPASAQRGG
ncbi:MAG: prolyl oligopeptidase family serine peptidase [Planctomycetota bacterium]